MKDIFGFVAMATSIASGLAAFYFHGHVHLGLIALLVFTTGVAGYGSWRLLVPTKSPEEA